MPRRYYDDEWYEPRKRLPADGIKAKNQRGDFGASWWAKRWIAALERFGYGSRLTRGRTYARGGAVLNIDIAPGMVTAKVQGSRPQPYNVSLKLKPLDDAQWARASDAIAAEAIFAAKLLAGEMPQTIEEAFAQVKVPLFPEKAADLVTSCSCPDSANPCKHIAAVHYLLGERFDDDPFLLFQLRGRTREQIIDELRSRRAAAAPAVEAPPQPVEQAPALAELLAAFDEPGAELAAIGPRIGAPELDAAVLRRFGDPPAGTAEGLRAAYRALTKGALERLA